MRQFSALRMFLHAEAIQGQPAVNNADVDAFIRIGSDFTNNYYEYRKPLTMTPFNVSNMAVDQIWPATNEINIDLGELVQAKKNRDAAGWPSYVPYYTTDSKGNTIVIIGTPNIGGAKDIMLGLLNPKKSNSNPSDDGMPKCLEVWFDELRMAGLNDQAGYAAAGKASVQLADLGNVNVSGSMHTQGYGNIDQKIQQRSQDDYYQYNTSTNLNLGKLMPRSWGVQMPAYVGYTENVSTPKYNPYDQDVLLKDALAATKTQRQYDSLKQAAQDFTSITSFNFTNVRFQGNPAKNKKNRAPWSLKNFDFTYSYNNQFKHNPIIDLDILNTQRLGIGYSYSLKTKSFEPFRNRIKSKSKWLTPIKDINFTPLPSSFTMRNDLNRLVEETRARTFGDASTYQLPSTFYKNFTWTRLYTLRWELTRSLSFDYTATNISRIDEPYGRINTTEKKDSVINVLRTFGHNTSYAQSFNGTYNVPLSKFPLTDWMTLRLSYGANYSWLTAPPAAYTLGNTIGNTQTRTATGDVNLLQLYNKSRWLKAISSPPAQKKPPVDGSRPDLRPGQGPGQGPMGKNGPGKGGREAANIPEKDKTPGADNSTAAAPEAPQKPPKTKQQTLLETFPGLDISKLSDEQLDSLVDVQNELDKKKRKEDKKKRKAAKKAARKLRRQQVPELSPAVRAIGQVLTMVNRVTVNYTQTGGTLLPGYMDSTRFMGVNNYSGAPGFDFVYGYQPDYTWLAAQAAAGRLTHDSLFNSQFQQTYSRNISATAALQPQKDLRIDLTLTQTFSKSHSELYADTGTGAYNHFNPYETGAFSISTVTIGTMLKNTSGNSTVYNNFLDGRTVISRRLGASNPYTNGLPDPMNPGYAKGYGPYSQDVLIPSFLAAYSGKSVESAALMDYTHTNISDNPFKYFLPMPNWRLTYNGLSKLPFFQSVFNNFVLNHGYTGTTSMNSFNSSLVFQDLYGLGFPSFIDSNSHNYTPYFQVPNVTITQALNPLIGIDASFKNNLTAKFELRKSKTESLSLIDYQVSENLSTEYVIGIGFRKKGIRLPFAVFGIKKLKNELIVKADIGLRDEKSSNTFLANNINVVSRGQKVLRISPTIDYSVNQRLTLRLFYDRQQTIPYVSNSYPTTTTRAGITLRFIFAQ
jgi:cell surface protein SprA